MGDSAINSISLRLGDGDGDGGWRKDGHIRKNLWQVGNFQFDLSDLDVGFWEAGVSG